MSPSASKFFKIIFWESSWTVGIKNYTIFSTHVTTNLFLLWSRSEYNKLNIYLTFKQNGKPNIFIFDIKINLSKRCGE